MLASSHLVEAEPLDDLTLRLDDARAMLVLGHGAGSPMTSSFLTGFCTAIALLGIASHRFNFPYMQAGRRAPDRAPVLIAAFRDAARRAAAAAPELPLVAGGRSMGGRIASMAAAEGMDVAGLAFLAYPLHPPGPERIRDAHLYGLTAPMLFVQGTRDAFAQPELLSAVLQRLGERAELFSVDGGDHSFRRAGGPRDGAEIGAGLAPPVAAFIERLVAPLR
jgi:predicted alpha/beta-hydrolase family hydrolase